MKDEGGRMKGMLLVLESFYFILHPSSLLLNLLPLDYVQVKADSLPF
jgi:hypothetical protein